MGRLIRCVEGHIFPEEKGPLCPVCGAATSVQNATNAGSAAGDEARPGTTRQDQAPRQFGVIAAVGAAAVITGVIAFVLWPGTAPTLPPLVATTDAPETSDSAASSKTPPNAKAGEGTKKSADVKSAEPLITTKEEFKEKSAPSSVTPKAEPKGADPLRDVASLIPSPHTGPFFKTDIKVRPGQTVAAVKAAYGIVMDPTPDTSGIANSVLIVPQQGLLFYFDVRGLLSSIQIGPRYTGHVLGIRMSDPLARIRLELGDPTHSYLVGTSLASVYENLYWSQRVRFQTLPDGKLETIWIE